MSSPNEPPRQQTPSDRGFNWRSLMYAAIPLGFIVLVVAMLLGGEVVQETTDGIVTDSVEDAIE